jgi:hypothetical protein
VKENGVLENAHCQFLVDFLFVLLGASLVPRAALPSFVRKAPSLKALRISINKKRNSSYRDILNSIYIISIVRIKNYSCFLFSFTMILNCPLTLTQNRVSSIL